MMYRSMCSILVLSIVLLSTVIIGTPRADIPKMISYQGKVTDSGGTPVADGNYVMRFRIYTTSTGGSPIWDSSNQTIGVSGGVFNVLLGQSPQPVLDLDFDDDYWLLVTFVGTDQTPRQKLASAGYTYMSSGLVPGTEIVGAVTTLPFAALKAEHTSTFGGFYYGVYGVTRTTQIGMGVYGYAAATIGNAEGVRGEANSPDGVGVAGYHDVSSGDGTGVYGSTYSSIGFGVNGAATATTGSGYGVYGRTWSSSSSSHAIHAEVVATGSGHARALYAVNNQNDAYGYGVYGWGGWRGVYGRCSHSAATNTTYGVYGSATGGAINYGVYASGDMGCSGAKPAIVRTDNGPKAIYAQESPEIWFEDFGSDQLSDGYASVKIAEDFIQTITVNDQHPMKVFITPNADIGRWWVEKGSSGFILHAPDSPEGAIFDYRVVAKRRGYENHRLKPQPGSYADHYLYPDLNDVPSEYRELWIEEATDAERIKFGLPVEERSRNSRERGYSHKEYNRLFEENPE